MDEPQLLSVVTILPQYATVVQWIELSPPKGVIQVRFLSGAPATPPIKKSALIQLGADFFF